MRAPAVRSARRRPERGYALVVAAFAVLFLAVAAGVIVQASASGNLGARLETDAERASSLAAAGLELAMVRGLADGATIPPTQIGAAGTATVSRAGRTITSTGRAGLATRVAARDLTLFYVPGSRFSANGNTLAFEVFNRTGAPIELAGLALELEAPVYFETVALRVFGEGALPPIDYGTVYQFSGTRPGSGTRVDFSVAPNGSRGRAIATGRQALIEIGGFRLDASGASSAVAPAALDALGARATFLEIPAGGGAAQPLPPTPIAEVGQ